MPRVRTNQQTFLTAIVGLQAAAACLLLPVAPVGRVAAAGGLAGLVVLSSIRFQGRRLPEWIAARVRFRRRAALRRGYRPRAAIETVVPGVDTRGHADRAGNRVGLLADGPAWIAILRLDPIPDGAVVDRLDQLMALLSAASADVDVLQLVGWSVPRGGRARDALRTFWVAVRFEPTLHPSAVEARGGGEQGGVRAAAAAALRLAAALREQAFGVRVLDGTELSDEVCTSLGVEPAPRGGTGQPITAQGRGPSVRETWRFWSLGGLNHACFRLHRPPSQRAKLAALFTQLARPPAVTTCVSVVYRGGPPEVFVRLAVPADRNAFATWNALRRAAAGLRGRPIPMNGEHLPGVRATIPLAALP